jgi:hypothetical protein
MPLVSRFWDRETAALSTAFSIGERPPQAQPPIERIV